MSSGLSESKEKRNVMPRASTSLQEANGRLGKATVAVDNIELQDLGQMASDALDPMQTVEISLTDTLGTVDEQQPRNIREFQVLDKRLRTLWGKLTRYLAKLSELDEHIEKEKRKLDQADLIWWH